MNTSPKDHADEVAIMNALKNIFMGRQDVVAKKWQSKDGRYGYSPVCENAWKPVLCLKKDKGGSCDLCNHSKFTPVTDDLLTNHIRGEMILGTYPIHPDETVTFAAVDFDNHTDDKDPLIDVHRYHRSCHDNGFPLYILRSQSGNGFHGYLLFEKPLPGIDARKLVVALLDKARIDTSDRSGSSYDRIFPNQDHLSGKGLGNLIALPFQGKAMKNGHTVLLDPESGFKDPYGDQVEILHYIEKISADDVYRFIGSTNHIGDEPDKNQKLWDDHPFGTTSEADFGAIHDKCGFIHHCVKDAETLSEPEWYALMSITIRCRDGQDFAHALSRPYPGYSERETNQKTAHALNDTGPYTCEYIARSINGTYCKTCEFSGKVRSPIVLGLSSFVEEVDTAPLDFFGDTDVFGEPEWPDDACPLVIDAFARDEAARLGVCPSMIAMAAITVAAAAIPDTFKVQPKELDTEWTEGPRIWTMLTAEPGIKKTPSQSKAIAPLKEVEKELAERNKEVMKVYDRDMAHYKKWERRTKDHDIMDRPEKPRQERKMTNDPTVEALSEILSDNEQGVLIHIDELVRLIASMDCYRGSQSKGKDRADILELYNGGTRVIDRISRGNVSVPNWSACILGSIQPGPAKDNFASISDDGLIQRFDPHYGKLIGNGEDRVPNYEVIEAYDQLIKNLVLSRGFKLQVPDSPYKLSHEAQYQREMVIKTTSCVMILPSTSNAFKAALDKWDARFARYALIFHIVEAVSRGEQPTPRISGKTAARVARLMLAFLLPNAARFYNEILPSSQYMEPAKWIAGYILAQKTLSVRERDLYRANRNFRNSPDNLQQAMKILAAAGWVVPAHYRKNDGRINVWTVNPKCHTLFAQRAHDEKKRRQEVKEKIQEANKFLGKTNQTEVYQ